MLLVFYSILLNKENFFQESNKLLDSSMQSLTKNTQQEEHKLSSSKEACKNTTQWNQYAIYILDMYSLVLLTKSEELYKY